MTIITGMDVLVLAPTGMGKVADALHIILAMEVLILCSEHLFSSTCSG